MSKTLKIVSGTLNFLLFALGLLFTFDGVFGYLLAPASGILYIERFDGMVLLLHSLICLIYLIVEIRLKKRDKMPRWLIFVKYLLTSWLFASMLMLIALVAPIHRHNASFIVAPGNIFPLLVIPVLAFVTHCFFDERVSTYKISFLLSLIGPTLYLSVVAIIIIAGYGASTPYSFLNDALNEPWLLVIYGASILVISALSALLVEVVRRIVIKRYEARKEREERERLDDIREHLEFSSLPDDSVYKTFINTNTDIDIVTEDEDSPYDEASIESEPQNAKKKPKPIASLFKGRARVYHISKQSSGRWQVKLATGLKAIKLFDIQAEAIDYAKELVHSQGGSIRIHSKKGKIRK